MWFLSIRCFFWGHNCVHPPWIRWIVLFLGHSCSNKNGKEQLCYTIPFDKNTTLFWRYSVFYVAWPIYSMLFPTLQTKVTLSQVISQIWEGGRGEQIQPESAQTPVASKINRLRCRLHTHTCTNLAQSVYNLPLESPLSLHLSFWKETLILCCTVLMKQSKTETKKLSMTWLMWSGMFIQSNEN